MSKRAEDFLDSAESFLDSPEAAPSTKGAEAFLGSADGFLDGEDTWADIGGKVIDRSGHALNAQLGGIEQAVAVAKNAPGEFVANTLKGLNRLAATGLAYMAPGSAARATLPGGDPLIKAAGNVTPSSFEPESVERIKADPMFQRGADRFAYHTDRAEELKPNVGQWSPKGIAAAAGEAVLTSVLPAMATGTIGGVVAGLSPMAAQVYGQKIGEMVKDGKSLAEAQDAAGFAVLAETVPEAVPLGYALKVGTPFWRRIFGTAWREGATEQITELLTIEWEKNKGEVISLKDAMLRLAYAGTVGAAVGAPMGAIGAVGKGSSAEEFLDSELAKSADIIGDVEDVLGGESRQPAMDAPIAPTGAFKATETPISAQGETLTPTIEPSAQTQPDTHGMPDGTVMPGAVHGEQAPPAATSDLPALRASLDKARRLAAESKNGDIKSEWERVAYDLEREIAASAPLPAEPEVPPAALPASRGPRTAAEEKLFLRERARQDNAAATAQGRPQQAQEVTPTQPATRGAPAPPAPATGRQIEDIHALADRKHIAWDNDPDFMDFTESVTGKRHLDALNETELKAVYTKLAERPETGTKKLQTERRAEAPGGVERRAKGQQDNQDRTAAEVAPTAKPADLGGEVDQTKQAVPIDSTSVVQPAPVAVSGPGRVYSAFDKTSPDSAYAGVARLRDFNERDSLSIEGLGKLDVPSQGMVVDSVVAAIHDLKIRDAVISALPVDVVNDLSRQQLTPEMLFDNKAMLQDAIFRNGNFPISGRGEPAHRLVSIAARYIAKRIPDSDDFRGIPDNQLSTKGARNTDLPVTEKSSATAGTEITGSKQPRSADVEKGTATSTIDGRHDVTPRSDVGLGPEGAQTPSVPSILSTSSRDSSAQASLADPPAAQAMIEAAKAMTKAAEDLTKATKVGEKQNSAEQSKAEPVERDEPQSTETADETADYRRYAGRMVKVRAVDSKGRTTEIEEDAAEALRRIDKQETFARRLLECLSL